MQYNQQAVSGAMTTVLVLFHVGRINHVEVVEKFW